MGDLSTREQIRADSACDATTRVVGFSCPDGTIPCERRPPHDMHFNWSHCRTGHSWFTPLPSALELAHREIERNEYSRVWNAAASMLNAFCLEHDYPRPYFSERNRFANRVWRELHPDSQFGRADRTEVSE